MKFPYFDQSDSMDCGPTCLRMVAKYYKRSLSAQSLKLKSEYNKQGVSFLGISRAAEKTGFKTLSVKIRTMELTNDVPLPCILHWNQNHFIVLYKVTKNKFTIADPAKGILELSKEEFTHSWISNREEQSGLALLLEPTAVFYEQEDDDEKRLGWGLLSKYSLKYRAQFFQLFVGLLLGSLLQLIFPFLTQSIVDTGINTGNLNFIQLVLIAQFTLFFARTVVEFIRSRILLFVSTHINLSILSDFWIKLMRLPLNFFDTKQTGDILQRINDNRRIETF